ncbi:MAG: hypothetical protein M3Z04_25460 [Chloroflexota bacterium]|nr:hypothetical protein [Chloroflexota bacterium]
MRTYRPFTAIRTRWTTRRKAGLGLFSGGMSLNGFAAGVLFMPGAVFPNPFCLLYQNVSPWAYGAIMLGLIAAVVGFAMMFLNSGASSRLTGGLMFLGVAMLILGIVSTDAGLNSVAGIFGVPAGHWCAQAP